MPSRRSGCSTTIPPATVGDDPGIIEAGVHRIRVRVYYEDTDAAGIVYHAAYLEFAERARTEMLRCLGLDHAPARPGLVFTVRRCAIDYRAPARLDDLLEVETGSFASAAPRSSWSSACCARDACSHASTCVWRCSARISASRVPRELVVAFDGLCGPRE